jgi:putative ATP-dependent endonuclease of the OLD family
MSEVHEYPPPSAATILRLTIERFRGIKSLSWYPSAGVNVVLGGGDVGKSTILDAIALLLAPPTVQSCRMPTTGSENPKTNSLLKP